MQRIIVLALILTLLLCSACRQAPDTPVVGSKRNGAIDAILSQNLDGSIEGHNSRTSVTGTNHFYETGHDYNNSFSSTDGTANYRIQVSFSESGFVSNVLPTIKVTPGIITEEHAQRIAYALFPNETVYEYSDRLTKSQLEEEILFWQKKIQDADLSEYGTDKASQEAALLVWQSILNSYLEQYNSADDSLEPEECHWTFYPESHYENKAIYSDTIESECIMATIIVNGLHYQYRVHRRDQSDYKLQCAFLLLSEKEQISLLSTQRPDEKQLQAAEEHVLDMLYTMGLEDWYVSSVFSDSIEYDGKQLYQIVVKAYPQYDQVPVTPHEQLMNLKQEDVYASNYYYSEITFRMNCDLQPLYFEYQSPMQVDDIIRSNTPTLSFDEAMDRVKDHLSLFGADSYRIWNIWQTQTALSADIKIQRMEIGLTRIRLKDQTNAYCYVPSLTVYGEIWIQMKDGQRERVGDDALELLVLNLIDGSIIDISKGY